MSLWLVDMNQRTKKPGLWSASWCASCASCGFKLRASAVVLIELSSLLILRRRGLVGRGLLDRRLRLSSGRRRRGRSGGGLRARRMAALGRDPLRELRRRGDLDADWHVAMARSAQLGALAEIDPRA